MTWSYEIEEKIRLQLLRIDPKLKEEILGGYFYRRMPNSVSNFYMRDALAYLKELCDPDAKILDYGCGVGVFLLYLWAHGFRNLYGIDSSKDFINIGTELMKAFNASVNLKAAQHDDIYNIAKGFNAIIMFDYLHEARFDLPKIFSSVANALTPNGFFLFSLQIWNIKPQKTRVYRSTLELLTLLKTAGLIKKATITHKNASISYSLYVAGKKL